MDDERRFDGLPIRRQAGPGWLRVCGAHAGSQGIGSAVGRIELAGGSIDPPHLDSAPETSKAQPWLPFAVEHDVGIDRVEIIALCGFQNQAFIFPGIFWARRVEGLVRRKRNAGSVYDHWRFAHFKDYAE